jgi:hypothetical protein
MTTSRLLLSAACLAALLVSDSTLNNTKQSTAVLVIQDRQSTFIAIANALNDIIRVDTLRF